MGPGTLTAGPVQSMCRLCWRLRSSTWAWGALLTDGCSAARNSRLNGSGTNCSVAGGAA